jgi:chromosome partitioning protein
MPLTVAVLNQKGGSGKTTIATNLAYALKRDSHKVLLVDADQQVVLETGMKQTVVNCYP